MCAAQFLLVFRGLVGLGLGGAPVAFALYLEFAPSRCRGVLLVALQGFWTLGSMVEVRANVKKSWYLQTSKPVPRRAAGGAVGLLDARQHAGGAPGCSGQLVTADLQSRCRGALLVALRAFWTLGSTVEARTRVS